MASGVLDLLRYLQDFHMTVHLSGLALHQFHHLTQDLNLLIAQLLALNQGSLDAVQHSEFLGTICLSFQLLIMFILFFQDFLAVPFDLLHH